MRPGGVGLLAAVLALAGCKGTDPKPGGAREPAGTPASRPKGASPAWLDDSLAKLSGAGTGVPKANTWADGRDPNFDVNREVKGLIAGRVLDPAGQPAKNVFIRIDPADAAPGDKGGAAQGIMTNGEGYFGTSGLQPGRAYTLSVETKMADGRAVFGSVQTRPPQPNIALALRDDLPPSARPAPGSGLPPGGGLPPTDPPRERPKTGGSSAPDLPPGGPGSDTPLPPPAGLTDDHIPPMGLSTTPKPPAAPPADGAFAPGFGATSGGLPATVGGSPGPAPAAALPPSDPKPAEAEAKPTAVTRPENTAAGPAPPWKPPAANIPGPAAPPVNTPAPPAASPPGPPPVPALPSLPVPATPPAPGSGGGKQSAKPVRPGASFALVDTADRPWDLATARSGSVVLVDFMTTSCVPCKKSVPGLIDLQARYANDGLELVGVVCDPVPSADRRAAAEKYQRDHRLNYALYVEPGSQPGAVQKRFGVAAYPTAVLLDPEGTPVWTGNPNDLAGLEAAVKRQLGK